MSRIFFLLVLMFALVLPAAADPVPPPEPGDRCPVCGMFVAPHRSWVAAAVLTDGRRLYFDGAKDLFRFHFNPSRYQVAPEQVGRMFVTDYYSLRLIPIEEAWFVRGSDVLGPMGHELVPLESRDTAVVFRRDHGGNRILSFTEVTPADLPDMK